MKFLTQEQFVPIIRTILSSGLVARLQEYGTIMPFLSSLWELRTMRSHDNRYNNLYDDIVKHWVDNFDDYDDDNLFFTRLNILSDNKLFLPFIEAVVNPAFITDETARLTFVKVINTELTKLNIELCLCTYNEGLPIYRVMQQIKGMDASDILRNTIPFYVEKSPTGYSNKRSSHDTPVTFPAFLLVSDDGWSDGYAHVQFNLWYYESANKYMDFGLVKISKEASDMRCDQENHYYVKNDGMPDKFLSLPPEFCSLGQDSSYYSWVKNWFPDTYMSVFLAMRDVAVFSQIDDQFKNTPYYSCLTRENRAERNIREARILLEGRNIADRYSFDYIFQPKFASNNVSFHFGFRMPKQPLAKRMYAIIGKNGVGKTLFISSLPQDLASDSEENFRPAKPILSKVISFSESNFDNFKEAENNSRLNYVHKGMVVQGEDGSIPKSRIELSADLMEAYRKITHLGRIKHLKRVLSRMIEETVLDYLIEGDNDSLHFVTENLTARLGKMSSGENIMYYLFCMLESEMRYDSLVLLDEPETHLHPNAISEMLSALDDMLYDYESCCIMVTHSPMLVRELSSDCVYVMEREGGLSIVRRPGVETLGGNLTTLTDDIFGSREVQRNYKRRIAEMAPYMKYEELISSIKSEDLPLGLGIDLYIRSLYPNKNHEET